MSISTRIATPSTLRLCLLTAMGLCAPAISQAVLPTVVNAKEVINAETSPTTELDELVVTATRAPTKVTNTIAQTTVVDKEALKLHQGESVLDVLKRQPGISYYSNGGMGTTSNFYMRGYDNKQILVLIDGVRYSSLSAGGASLQLIPADQIDRIEILHGASGSSIYGADAMGGVIQIFTKGNNIERNQVSVTAGVGSHDQYLYGASAQLTNDKGTALSLSASHNETDGFNVTLPEPGNQYANYNKDKDGFESDNYSLLLSQRINEALQVGASALYSESKTEYDKGATQGPDETHSEQKNGAAQAFIDWSYAQDSSMKLSYGRSIDRVADYGYDTNYETDQQQVSLVGRHQLPTGQAVFGAEHLTQSLDSDVYSADDRKVTSGFLGYVLGSDTVDAQANIRYDVYSEYGSETTYNVGGAYHLNPDIRVGANYAKGFRAPTFNDLYYPGSVNTDLVPESSDNYEAFVEYATGLQSTRLTGYRSKVDDMLAYMSTYDTAGNWTGGRMENVDQAKIEGITLTSDWYLNNYLMGLSYDYQKAKDASGGFNDGNFLAIRPEHKGLVYVGYQWPSFDIRAEYQYVGDYYSNIANLESQEVDSYGLVNISGNYRFSPQLSMTARLNNLTNKEYVTLPNYNADGTNFFTSLTYNFY